MGADIEELKQKIAPIADKYGLQAVYLFGSRARGDAHADSDYDFYIEKGKLHSLFQLAGLRLDLVDVLKNNVDVITNGINNKRLLMSIERDRVLVYGS